MQLPSSGDCGSIPAAVVEAWPAIETVYVLVQILIQRVFTLGGSAALLQTVAYWPTTIHIASHFLIDLLACQQASAPYTIQNSLDNVAVST
jgi:hypothetical protein